MSFTKTEVVTTTYTILLPSGSNLVFPMYNASKADLEFIEKLLTIATDIRAVENKVAEACARLVERQAEVGMVLHQISIRSGEWRKYYEQEAKS